MDDAKQSELGAGPTLGGDAPEPQLRGKLVRWAIILGGGFAIALAPSPSGITVASWRLLAIFAATIVGTILRPIPGGAMVLLGVSTVALTGTLPIRDALGGYADPIVWMVLAAFF